MRVLWLILLVALTSGCATRAALQKPGPVDRSVLSQGQDRMMVVTSSHRVPRPNFAESLNLVFALGILFRCWGIHTAEVAGYPQSLLPNVPRRIQR